MNIMYKEALDLWVSNDRLRTDVTKPFIFEGKAMATNFHGLAYCPDYLVVEKLQPYTGKIEFKKVLIEPPYEYGFQITLNDLIDALNKCEQEPEKKCTDDTPCNDCNGDGEVEFVYESNNGQSYELDHECPVCNGSGIKGRYIKTGRMKPVGHANIQIGKKTFSAFILDMVFQTMEILDLKNMDVLNASSNEGPILLKGNDFYLLIMPTMTNEIDKYPQIPITITDPSRSPYHK